MAVRVVLSRDGVVEREIRLDEEITVIGRHPGCDVVIADPAVSLRHMLLRAAGDALVAEDLESTNGTLVNEVAVKRQLVQHLDVIRIGRHKLHVFEESRMGVFAGLEHTVHVEDERTMVLRARQVAESSTLGLQRLDHERAAGVVDLELAHTMIGEDQEQAMVVRRHGRLFVTKVSAGNRLLVNGREMGAGAHPVDVDDVIAVGSQRFRVVALGM
jgi:predicted component of type VI protein secretion system